MSNRPVFFLCFSMRIKEKKRLHVFFALPLFVLFALVDMLRDWASLALLFHPRAKPGGKVSGAAAFDNTLRAVSAALYELAFRTGPFNLLDIDVRSKKDTVFLKLRTR